MLPPRDTSLLEAVSLAAYFLLSAATGDRVLPPLVMAWAGLGTGAVRVDETRRGTGHSWS